MKKHQYTLDEVRKALKASPSISWKEINETDSPFTSDTNYIAKATFYAWPKELSFDIDVLNAVWNNLLPNNKYGWKFDFESDTDGLHFATAEIVSPVGEYLNTLEIIFNDEIAGRLYKKNDRKCVRRKKVYLQIHICMTPTESLADKWHETSNLDNDRVCSSVSTYDIKQIEHKLKS